MDLGDLWQYPGKRVRIQLTEEAAKWYTSALAGQFYLDENREVEGYVPGIESSADAQTECDWIDFKPDETMPSWPSGVALSNDDIESIRILD